MEEIIKQHFVPRTYLKHFSTLHGKNYFISFLSKKNASIVNIKESNIKDICYEKHLYTLEGGTKKERMWVENLYSDVFESNYDRVYSILIDKKKIKLTKEERLLIISTVVSMYYRTNSWHRTIENASDHIIERLYYLAVASKMNRFKLGNEVVVLDGKSLDDIKSEFNGKGKSSIILLQVKHILELINLRIQSDTIMVDELKDAEFGFITSDNPVSCKNINQSHIIPSDPSNVFSLPLNSTHLLSIMPSAKPEWMHGVYRNTHKDHRAVISKIASNSKQYSNSQQFILGSKMSIEGFLKDLELLRNPDENTKKLFSII